MPGSASRWFSILRRSHIQALRGPGIELGFEVPVTLPVTLPVILPVILPVTLPVTLPVSYGNVTSLNYQ